MVAQLVETWNLRADERGWPAWLRGSGWLAYWRPLLRVQVLRGYINVLAETLFHGNDC